MTRPLLEDWQALLARRPALRSTLAPYETILAGWMLWPPDRPAPLRWSEAQCRARWERGEPLLPDNPPPVSPEDLESLLGTTMDVLGAIGDVEPLRRFAEAWDAGTVPLTALFPARGRLADPAVQARTGLTQESLGFLAYGSLRPVLEGYLAGCRAHLVRGVWGLGVCPFCGSPPGFAEIPEDGQRRLACHLCGGTWGFPRLQCPHCGSQRPADVVRLLAEDREEGYAIVACRACQGYVKEVDRRLRWDTGPALVEDWGTPHLDLVAGRQEYWRPVPTLVHLNGAG